MSSRLPKLLLLLATLALIVPQCLMAQNKEIDPASQHMRSEPMLYTIEIRASGAQVAREVAAQFTEDEFDDLWVNLAVTKDRWEAWQESLTEGKPMDLLDGMPEFSRLAAVDEGSIVFADDHLRSFQQECKQLLIELRGSSSEGLISRFLSASLEAEKVSGRVAVHPFPVVN